MFIRPLFFILHDERKKDMFRLFNKSDDKAGVMYLLISSVESVLKYSIIPGSEDSCVKETLDMVMRMVKDIDHSLHTITELFKDSSSDEYERVTTIYDAYDIIVSDLSNTHGEIKHLLRNYIQTIIGKHYSLYNLLGITSVERKIQRELFRHKTSIFGKRKKNPIADIIEPGSSVYTASMELIRSLIPESELHNIDSKAFNSIIEDRFSPEEYEMLCDAISVGLVVVVLEEFDDWKNEYSWLAATRACSMLVHRADGLFDVFKFWCCCNQTF